MKAEELLKKALRKLQKHGVGKGALMDVDTEQYCAAGAIYSAAGASDRALLRASLLAEDLGKGMQVTLPFDFIADNETADSVPVALRALEKVIRRAEFGGRYDAYRGIYTDTGLGMFNDDHPELVISAMKQAIREARQ